jgi:flagellar biosynthesis regulator FlbT
MYQDVIFNIDSKMKEIEKIFEDPELIKALEELSAQESNNLQIEEDELLMIIRKNSYEKKTLLGKKQEINSNAFINDFKSLYKKKSNKNEQSIKRLLKALKSIRDFYSKQFTTLTQEKKTNSIYEQNKKPFKDWRDIEIVPVYDERNNFQKR